MISKSTQLIYSDMEKVRNNELNIWATRPALRLCWSIHAYVDTHTEK